MTTGRPATLRGGFGQIIVRRAIERLGGSMEFGKSDTLGGAPVRVTLPSGSSPSAEASA